MIRVGTCSWTDHKPFYPPLYERAGGQSARLAYYSHFFSLVEVDSTYYALQPARNLERWAAQTPPDFRFNVKAYGELTWHHRTSERRVIEPAIETHRRFSQMVQPLRTSGKLAALHFQFAPWFDTSDAHRDYLQQLRDLYPDDQLAVEFRNRSWYSPQCWETIRSDLATLGFVYVVVDEPQVGRSSAPPVIAATSSQLAIFRFHGRNRATWYIKEATSSGDRFDYLYDRSELEGWVPAIQQISHQVAETHVLLNNNRSNYAVINAFDFLQLLGLPMPPAPGAVAPILRERGLDVTSADPPVTQAFDVEL